MGARIEQFDVWMAGYAGASVAIFIAGTQTLANVFFDEALTDPAANPQTLSSMSSGGVSFGKFAEPIYIGVPYQMTINSTDETGIIRPPLTTMEAADASKSTVQVAGGTEERELEDILAETIDVLDQGVFLPVTNPNASSATNAATLASAIGIAATLGGGHVIVPAGNYTYTSVSVPAGVVVKGQGRDVTTLQSVFAGKVATISGERAGFEDLTLDGVSLQAGSIGVYAKATNEIIMRNVLVKRFETGAHFRGGKRFDFENFYIDNCVTGMKGHGDDDASGGNDGDDFMYNRWNGGRVTNCTTRGVHLAYVDRKCWHNGINDVGFENNTGTALKVEGARWTDLDGSWFAGNGKDLEMGDEASVVADESNQVIGFHMKGGVISSDMSFTGRCQDVLFERVELADGTYTFTTLDNNILALDCTESLLVALAGADSTKFTRARSVLGDAPATSGVTTGNVATEGWAYELSPGERVSIEAVIVANGRNVNEYAMYHIGRPAHRPPSTLNYDGQTANFTTGQLLTGTTSGATARIAADADAGLTGTLSLRDIVGEFLDDEVITDGATGVAIANGVLAHQNAALLGATTSIQAAVESDAAFACDFGVTAGKVIINVTGVAAKTMEWTVSARVTSA